MKNLLPLIGKTVRFSYTRNGHKNAIAGHLKSVKEDRVRIGDQWVMLVEGFSIEEVEYKGT